MNNAPTELPRRKPAQQTTLHIVSDSNTTIRTWLNPFRLTEDPRHPNKSANLLYTITKQLQEIVNKTSSIQQQIHLNNIHHHLKDVSHEIDRINAERIRFSRVFETLQIAPQPTIAPFMCPFSPAPVVVETLPQHQDEAHTESLQFTIEIDDTPVHGQ